jgi:hypothetical protein
VNLTFRGSGCSSPGQKNGAAQQAVESPPEGDRIRLRRQGGPIQIFKRRLCSPPSIICQDEIKGRVKFLPKIIDEGKSRFSLPADLTDLQQAVTIEDDGERPLLGDVGGCRAGCCAGRGWISVETMLSLGRAGWRAMREGRARRALGEAAKPAIRKCERLAAILPHGGICKDIFFSTLRATR